MNSFRLRGLGASLWMVALGMELVLLALGQWQYVRWGEKTRQQALIKERQNLPPLRLEELQPTPAVLYRKIALKGVFLHDQEKHLQARVHQGKVGVNVVTPFQVEDGRLIWVNRGWTPDLGLPFYPRPKRTIVLKGVVLPVSPAGRFTPRNDPGTDQWYTLQPNTMDPQTAFSHSYIYKTSPRDDQEALVERWVGLSPEHHVGYMLTWWTLALVVLIWFGACYRQKNALKQSHTTSPEEV